MSVVLPSFIDLMRSLDLDNDVQGPGVSPKAPHVRAASVASVALYRSSPYVRHTELSPSIVVTQPGVRSASADGRRRTSPHPARYSPYAAPIDLRRGSVPTLYSDEVRHDAPSHRRSNSSSPQISLRKPTALRISGVHRRRDRLSVAHADLDGTTPISTLVRRKSPQASPTSAFFPSQVQDSPPFPLTPVSVPTLPPAVFSSLQSFSFPGGDEDDDVMSGGMYVHPIATKERARTGIRISGHRSTSSEDIAARPRRR